MWIDGFGYGDDAIFDSVIFSNLWFLIRIIYAKKEKRKMNGAASSAGSPLEWRFSQVFGERTAGEEVQEGNHCVTRFRDWVLDPEVIWGLVIWFVVWIWFGWLLD